MMSEFFRDINKNGEVNIDTDDEITLYKPASMCCYQFVKKTKKLKAVTYIMYKFNILERLATMYFKGCAGMNGRRISFRNSYSHHKKTSNRLQSAEVVTKNIHFKYNTNYSSNVS